LGASEFSAAHAATGDLFPKYGPSAPASPTSWQYTAYRAGWEEAQRVALDQAPAVKVASPENFQGSTADFAKNVEGEPLAFKSQPTRYPIQRGARPAAEHCRILLDRAREVAKGDFPKAVKLVEKVRKIGKRWGMTYETASL
jgi:hypothetical protein